MPKTVCPYHKNWLRYDFSKFEMSFPRKGVPPPESPPESEFLRDSCLFKSVISSYVADGVSQPIRTNIIQKITMKDFPVFDNVQNSACDVIKCDVINSLILHDIVLKHKTKILK